MAQTVSPQRSPLDQGASLSRIIKFHLSNIFTLFTSDLSNSGLNLVYVEINGSVTYVALVKSLKYKLFLSKQLSIYY